MAAHSLNWNPLRTWASSIPTLQDFGDLLITIDIDVDWRDPDVMGHLQAAMRDSLAVLLEGIRQYPPRRAGQTYIRGQGTPDASGRVRRITSQDLGHKWTLEVVTFGNEVRGTVGNNVTYGPYVQSREMQAWMHQGRWDTIEDVIEQHTDDIEAIFADEMGRL
jgi:hypothetical protein